MALENYTRRQKLMLIGLTIVGAAMFTVTGSMLAVAESCGSDQLSSTETRGTLGDRGISSGDFQDRSRIVNMLESWKPFVRVAPDPNLQEQLVRHGQPRDGWAPLMLLWPAQHDQRVWLYMAALERARAAGFTPPGLSAANEWYFKNIAPTDAPKNASELDAHYRNRGILDRDAFLRSLAEYIMLVDYVEALNQTAHVSAEEALAALRQSATEYKARIYSLDAERFMARAEDEYARRARRARLGEIAGALSGAGRFDGLVDPLEQIDIAPAHFEERELAEETRVAFDGVAADVEAIAAGYPSSAEERLSFYQNMRGTVFRAPSDARDGDAFEERVRRVVDKEERRLGGNEPPGGWEAWKRERRDEMKVFMAYQEVESDVDAMLRRFKAEQLARVAIGEFKKELDELRNDREKVLKAEVATLKLWSVVPEKAHALYESVERAAKGLAENAAKELGQFVETKALSPSASKTLLNDLRRALTGESASNLRGHVKTLRTVVNIEQIEGDLRRSEMDREDATGRLSPDDKDPEKLEEPQRAEYRLEAEQRRIELARDLRPKILAVCDQLDALLADLELRMAALADSPTGAESLRRLGEELRVTLPARLREVSGGIVDKDAQETLKRELDTRKDVHTRAEKDVNDRKQDLSDVDLRYKVENFMREKGYALTYLPGIPADAPVTVRELGRNPTWHWAGQVGTLKSFLSQSNNKVGHVSQVIERAGFAHYLVRISARRDEIKHSVHERPDLAKTFALRRIARQLCREEMERIRARAVSTPDSRVHLDQLVAAGVLSVVETKDSFVWGSAPAEYEPTPEPDGTGPQGPAEQGPSRSFFSAFENINAGTTLSRVFVQGSFNPERPATGSAYRYSLALPSEHRLNPESKLPGAEWELLGVKDRLLAPARAANEDLLALLDPVRLLRDLPVTYYAGEYERDGAKDRSSSDP